jgi:hypothetical protein
LHGHTKQQQQYCTRRRAQSKKGLYDCAAAGTISHKIHERLHIFCTSKRRSHPQTSCLFLSYTHIFAAHKYSIEIIMMKGLWMVSAAALCWCTLAAATADHSETTRTVLQLRRSLVGRPVDATTQASRRLHVQSLRRPDTETTTSVPPLQRQQQQGRRLQRRKLPGTCVCVCACACACACACCVQCACVCVCVCKNTSRPPPHVPCSL